MDTFDEITGMLAEVQKHYDDCLNEYEICQKELFNNADDYNKEQYRRATKALKVAFELLEMGKEQVAEAISDWKQDCLQDRDVYSD